MLLNSLRIFNASDWDTRKFQQSFNGVGQQKWKSGFPHTLENLENESISGKPGNIMEFCKI